MVQHFTYTGTHMAYAVHKYLPMEYFYELCLLLNYLLVKVYYMCQINLVYLKTSYGYCKF